MHAQSLSRVWFFATPRTVAHQAPLSLGIPRQEYWSGLPYPPPGIFLTQELNLCLLCLLHCRRILYPLSHLGSPACIGLTYYQNKWAYMFYIFCEISTGIQCLTTALHINERKGIFLLMQFEGKIRCNIGSERAWGLWWIKKKYGTQPVTIIVLGGIKIRKNVET